MVSPNALQSVKSKKISFCILFNNSKKKNVSKIYLSIKRMPNAIKYSVSSETLALKRGNFYIGTGDVGKGPTSSTGYYNGVTPPAGGYTIYLNKESNGPSIYSVSTESQLISITNTIGGQSFTTLGQSLNWFVGQTDKMVLNKDYPAIITDGLVLNLDAGFTPSYPTINTTWYDVSSGGNNGTLINGPTYSSSNGGTIAFDGIDDYVNCGIPITFTNSFTLSFFFKTSYSGVRLIAGMYNGSGADWWIGTLSNGTLNFSFGSPSKSDIATSTVVSDGLWRMATFIYNKNSNSIFIYLDGVLENSSSSLPSTVTQPGGNMTIGRFGDTPGFYWNGNISTFQLYNKVLNSQEITQNYNVYLGSAIKPANSATEIMAANPWAGDGYYWINTSLGPKQLYCIMNPNTQGGGWMGLTSEIAPVSDNLLTTASWVTNSNGNLESANSSILDVNVYENSCGSPTYYELTKPSTYGINYSSVMMLMYRIGTIGQCAAISNGYSNGYYTGPNFTGDYNSYGMCNWNDGIFSPPCCGAQNMTGLKLYWVMLGSGSNSQLRYQVQCAGGTGKHYHMWFVK
jgi:hypothetical protein